MGFRVQKRRVLSVGRGRRVENSEISTISPHYDSEFSLWLAEPTCLRATDTIAEDRTRIL